MYRLQIQTKMRLIYILLVSLFSFSCFSQSNETEKGAVNSNNMNYGIPATNNSINLNSETSIEDKADSISTYKIREEKINQVVKKKEASQKNKSVTIEETTINSAPSQVQSTISASESMSSSFSKLKIQSSVQRNQRTPTEEQQSQMDETVNYFEKYAPESFEYHFYKYVAGNYSISLVDHLFKAEELKPNNVDVQIQLAAYYLIIDDSSNAIGYLKKIKEIGKVNDDILTYGKDLLLSAPENGTLITHGFDDTYSCVYLQLIEHVRTDVQLISLDLLQSQDYKRNLEEKGYVLPSSSVIDIAYLQTFCSQNENKSLSISLTTPKEYFQQIQEKLYVVGLVFEYHSTAFNNFYKNDYLWNEVLEKKLVYSSLNEKSKQISSNYLPMLLQLRSFYVAQKSKDQVKMIDEALDKVSVQCKKYDQVQKIKKAN